MALPEHHTALSNRRDIIELRSEFESHLATLGLEIVATTENLSSEEDEYDNENQLNPAETPEGSEARIEIVDPVRFLGVLPQLIDAATSAPCLAATLARIAENLRLQLEDKERPSTTSLLRQKLQPCGFELLSQFQRLAVSKEELRKIAQHCLHER